MTRRPSPRVYGYKDILTYLNDEHGLLITRSTLHRYSKRADPFPMTTELDGRRLQCHAHKRQVDSWMRRNFPHPVASDAT